MAPNTTLQLGDFVFSELEIPATMPFGGDQALSVHRLIGGTKVVDAMGASPREVSWSGLLLGATASDRARYLDTLRVQGLPLDLTWSSFKYSVIVRSFAGEFRRAYEMAYTITCEVISDSTTPVTTLAASSADRAISQDAATAASLTTSVGDAPLSGLMSTVKSAISQVSSFATAARSTINGVIQPIAAAQAQVKTLIASASNTIAEVTTFGGVLPGNPVATMAAKLTGQVTAATQLVDLHNLDFTLGRLTKNLQQVSASPRTVATAGGNLFRLAQQQYGDAKAWPAIAKANGLTDPFISGTQVLTIPAQPGTADGVLEA